MSLERVWILILTTTSFLSGLAGGILFSIYRIPAERPGPFPAYEARLVQTYDLDEEHARWLHGILARFDADIDELKARHVHELEPELIKAGETCAERIRRWVIPPDRRNEFDRMARGTSPAASHP